MGFSVGDRVTWEANGRGTRNTHSGIVQLVVPKGRHPRTMRDFKSIEKNCSVQSIAKDTTKVRGEESYIIVVEPLAGSSGLAKPKAFWPRTSWLPTGNGNSNGNGGGVKKTAKKAVAGAVKAVAKGAKKVVARVNDWD